MRHKRLNPSSHETVQYNYTRLFVTLAIIAVILAGLLLIGVGVGLITGYWVHFEDGSGIIGGDMVKIAYCNPFDICMED